MGVTVATIAREPWPVLDRFIRWHMGQGVDRIILYLDDPADLALPRLRAEPRLEVRLCTPEYWARNGLSPESRFTRRQRHVLSEAYASVSEGWLLVVDADELMWLRDGMLQTLNALPDGALSLRVNSAEEVRLADGAAAFRAPIPRNLVSRVYGDDADLLRIRHGLVYHPEGKSFHRAGQSGLQMKLHWALDATGARTPGPVLGPSDRAHLLHFAAPDYQTWRAKVDWRAGAHGFAQPVKDRLAAIDTEAEYRALYHLLHDLGPDRATALEAAGGLIRDWPGV